MRAISFLEEVGFFFYIIVLIDSEKLVTACIFSIIG